MTVKRTKPRENREEKYQYLEMKGKRAQFTLYMGRMACSCIACKSDLPYHCIQAESWAVRPGGHGRVFVKQLGWKSDCGKDVIEGKYEMRGKAAIDKKIILVSTN